MMKLFFVASFLIFFGCGEAKFDFGKIRDVIEENAKFNTTIALMIDASAKSPPNGILRGNFYNFGSYDGCLAINDGNIRGKYCYATLSIMEILAPFQENQKQISTLYESVRKKKQNLMKKIKPRMDDGTDLGFHFGVCVPNVLSADYLNEKVPGLVFDEDLCYPNEKKLETKHWIALGVLGGLVALSLLSTIYDIIIRVSGKKPNTIISSFSIYTNGKQLLKSSSNEDHLLCINGLRVLNMIWVIIGHVYVNYLLAGAIDNWKDAFDWMDQVGNMLIMSATVSVDSFFTIGGLLTVYIYMKSSETDLKESVKSVPLMYLHRYLRLTPALAVLVMVYATGLIEFLGNGPRWGLLREFAVEGCEERWWSSLIYIQNYMDSTQRNCIDQSWYLSVDMQLFILSPLILIPLKKWPKYVLPAMVGLVGAGVAIPFYIGYSNKFTGLVLGSTTSTFTGDYYYKTHARFGPYVIGMLAGYLIHKMRRDGKKFKLNIILSMFLWVVAIGALIACIFDGYELLKNEENALLDGLYVGLNRSVWSFAISLVILLCVSGNGGVINTFLSLPTMQLLSKLSYSMYLVHYFIITAVNLSFRDTNHFSNYMAIFQFFSFFILTLLVSVVYTLLFELPMIILQSKIFPKMRK